MMKLEKSGRIQTIHIKDFYISITMNFKLYSYFDSFIISSYYLLLFLHIINLLYKIY